MNFEDAKLLQPDDLIIFEDQNFLVNNVIVYEQYKMCIIEVKNKYKQFKLSNEEI